MNKREEIFKYSDPYIVYEKAMKLFGDDVQMDISNRNSKKYKIRGKFTGNKWVHFGFWGMDDYTYHHDKERRNNFRTRNHLWRTMARDSPAYISYHLLW